ncbi:SGT2 [Sanghuangporus sanghuang]
MSEKQQRLVLAIIEFLNQSIEDGTVKQDDREGLEVAIQCIGEAFGVDPNDEQQRNRLSIKPATLMNVFDVVLKTLGNNASSAAPPPSYAASTSSGPSAADKIEAEKLKAKGNQLMSSKNYAGAIDAYTQAIAKDGTNAVYYSNRAAAYSIKGDHASAILDAEKAIEIDPAFSKAYHRLGHAHYSLGDYPAASSAFQRGLEVDPNNPGLKSGLQNAEARTEQPTSRTPNPPTGTESGAGAGGGGLADLLGGLGGGGAGGGGMPDLASMMQNPMLMQMAQQMAANGGLERMMSNPAMQNMMNRVQSGGMPSMEEVMSDPSLRDLASQFMGGGAGRGGGPPAGSV